MAAGAAEAAAAVVEVGSAGQFEELLRLRAKSLLVVHFWAPWAPQCAQMNGVMAELAKEHPQASFVKLEAEAVPEVSEKYEISSVPTFLFFKNSQKIDRLDGAHAPELTKKVQRHASSGSFSPSGSERPKEDLSLRLKKLTHAAPCMLFMKGTPQEPRCGFSKQMVEILNKHNIQFSSFDIFSDEEVRQGLKTYSNWPTYPQLYVSGELIGGLDIIKELEASKELDTICPKAPKLEERLKVLTNKASVMLFMKGNKQEAKCGFSRQILEILNSTGIEYETFDILEDEEVRQGLKAYSNWPTYPQLYVKGELVGGLDIVKVVWPVLSSAGWTLQIIQPDFSQCSKGVKCSCKRVTQMLVTGAEAGQDCGGTQNPHDGALCLKPGYRKFQKRMVLCLTAGWLDRPLSCKVAGPPSIMTKCAC